VPLAPGVFVNANGSPELSGAAPTALFKRPAKHSALGEAVATGEFFAWTTPQEFLSHLVVEARGPLHTLAEGLTRFPGAVVAISALEPPHMQPQDDGMLQDGQVAEAPRSALLHVGAARLASGTHEVIIAALEMHIELLGAKHLRNHTKFWETEQRFETMEIHAHGFLLLVVFFWRGLSSILRGILCLSISGSQPLTIELRHWPQTWRRANIFVAFGRVVCMNQL